jgi:ubiquinone/menaquinone biosynthesis C-methylase UbiE
MPRAREALHSFYDWIKEIITPGLENSQYFYRDTLNAHLNESRRWLDLGCGHQIMPEWMRSSEVDQTAMVRRCQLVVGVDYDVPSLKKHKYFKYRLAGDIHNLPFRSGSFHLATANMVVEHLEDPNIALREVNRILEPGGLFIFHTPNLWNYGTLASRMIPNWLKNRLIELLEGRKEEDVFPAHYRLNSDGRIRAVAEASGFSVAAVNQVESSARTFILGPLAIFELLVLRILRFRALRRWRNNLIVILQKKGDPGW